MEKTETRPMSRLAKEINEKLHRGVVTFKFMKTDGKTIREATGTLCKDILPMELNKPNGTSSPDVQVFFDLDKSSWRSFRLGTEIEIVNFAEN